MPATGETLEKMKHCRSAMPCPEDLDEFWDARIREAWELPLEYTVTPSEIPENPACRFLEIRLKGVHGAELYCKYILPIREEKVPVVLQFHGYPGATRGWFEYASFAGMGMAVIGMDCPGLGGKSIYNGSPKGTVCADHIVFGLEGEREHYYYTEVFMDTVLMVRLALALEELDSGRIYCNGGSQGGGLALVCAALSPEQVKACASLYPFLTDYRTAWEQNRDTVVYTGLKYYSRYFDPAGEHTEELYRKLSYIDVINLAGRIRCPVLYGTGLMDPYISPESQFAVYDRLQCPKKQFVYPDYGHEEIPDFDDRTIRFFSKGGEL